MFAQSIIVNKEPVVSGRRDEGLLHENTVLERCAVRCDEGLLHENTVLERCAVICLRLLLPKCLFTSVAAG